MDQSPATSPPRGGRHPGRIAAARAQSYEPVEVAAAVRLALGPFGGARGIADGRKRVLLKPNVLRPASPEEAVTTHPEVIRAVAREFMAAGCEVTVGDAPGGDPGPALPAFEKSGIAGACRDLEIPLVNFQKEGSVEVALPYSAARKINVAKPVCEAECIVNLPKLKTHNLTQLTCALKNPYGYIPGFLKAKLHTLAPASVEFVQIICALWEVLPPAFTLIDAIVGMDGQGPSAGQPHPVGWILAGTDPLALDSVVATAMGYELRDVHQLREAGRRGLGVGQLDEIEITGASLEALVIQDFALPVTSRLERWAPRWLARFFGSIFRPFLWVRPHINPEACEICHRCVRTCPTGAMQAERGAVPRLALPRECISCLCCQEVCPARAIVAQKSLMVTKIFQSERRQLEAAQGLHKSGSHATDNE